MKHIVCLSGGHSSGHVALEVVNKYGVENVVLLNHDINSERELPDIKRFKREISDFVGIPITYANIDGINDPLSIPDQFDVIMELGALTSPNHNALCTAKLKTEPFYEYLRKHQKRGECIIYYGFDKTETERIERRTMDLGGRGYFTDFPLAQWENLKYKNTESVGIERANVYAQFKHANCIGCLKAGQLHWYVVFCTDKKAWNKAKEMEEQVGFSILRRQENNEKRRPLFLRELETAFCKLQSLGVPANEHIGEQKFADRLRKIEAPISENLLFPCMCSF